MRAIGSAFPQRIACLGENTREMLSLHGAHSARSWSRSRAGTRSSGSSARRAASIACGSGQGAIATALDRKIGVVPSCSIITPLPRGQATASERLGGDAGMGSAWVRPMETRSLCCGEHRQLSLESPSVRGPRLAAGDVGGQLRIFVQQS